MAKCVRWAVPRQSRARGARASQAQPTAAEGGDEWGFLERAEK